MEWVETTGRTIAEAKDAALDQLGVDEQEAEFEIMEEPKFGLFGRLRAEARVRARVRPTRPRPKDDRRDRRGRRRAVNNAAESASAVASPRAESDAETMPPSVLVSSGPDAKTDRSAATGAHLASTEADRGADEDAAADASGTGTGQSRRRRPRAAGAPASRPDTEGRSAGVEEPDRSSDASGSARAGGRRQQGSARTDNQRHDSRDHTSPGGAMDVSLDEQGAVARGFLEGLVDHMGLAADIELARPEEETIMLNLQGQDLGLLIGPKGSTLSAIQDLTRTVVQRQTGAANGRILVDVAGYRHKRNEALARFTRQIAGEVQSTGTKRVLEPMGAADRKIVHDTVNDLDGVSTASEGEEPRRRVVILPSPADE